jgi:hypothetical protein
VTHPSADFLRRLFGSAPADLYVLLWSLRQAEGDRPEEKASQFLRVADLDQAGPIVDAMAEDRNAYFGVGLQAKALKRNQRGKVADIAGLAGLWADIDITSLAHKQADLPPDTEHALELTVALGLPATEIVHSGHGLQAWWLFSEPWIFADDSERDRAEQLSDRFQGALRRIAEARGWKLDATADLARVLRPPGTVNRKPGLEPVPVKLLSSDGPRYRREDIAELLDTLADPGPPAAGRNGDGPHPFKPQAVGEMPIINRARRYVEKIPGAISHKHGHDQTFEVAQVLIRGFGLSIDQARPILEEYSQRCQPPWSAKELEHKLDSAENQSRRPTGYLLNRSCNGRSGHAPSNGKSTAPPGAAKAPPVAGESVTLGPLTIQRGPAHRTATRLNVPLVVFREGDRIDSLNLSKSVAGRREASKLLTAHIGSTEALPESEINRALSAIILAAEDSLDRVPEDTRPRIEDIVRARVSQAFQFQFRTERGAWSAAEGREVTRSDFLTFTPAWLLDACKDCADARAHRAGQLDGVRAALQVVWSDLAGTLPAASAAGLTPESAEAAATEFRKAIVRCWHSPCANYREIVIGGPPIIIGGSLITKIHEKTLPEPAGVLAAHKNKPPWALIHTPYRAWCKPWLDEESGEVVIRLGMRFELAGQLKIDLPGVSDPRSFGIIGRAFRLFDSDPKVTTRTSGGAERLVVLSREFAAELLDRPEADDGQDPEAGQEAQAQ